MESTLQKTFTQRWAFLTVAAVLNFILLICPSLSAAGQNKFVGFTDDGTTKVLNNCAATTICLVGIDPPEYATSLNVAK